MQRKEHLGRGRRGQRDDNEGRSAGGGVSEENFHGAAGVKIIAV
jgi:hypothetical protein